LNTIVCLLFGAMGLSSTDLEYEQSYEQHSHIHKQVQQEHNRQEIV